MWNENWKKGEDYPTWGNTDVYKKTISGKQLNRWTTMNKRSKTLRRKWLKSLVRQKKLTPVERLSSRLGYMGTAFMMMSPHLLPDQTGIITYIIAGTLSIPQVFVAKQWNLVAVNLNVAIAYIILYLS